MKCPLAIFIFLFITCINSFGKLCPSGYSAITSDTAIYIPADLNDCLIQLDRIIADSNKTKIAAMTEDRFSAGVHLSLGMWMRNNWGLWKGSRLSKFFNSKGIYHPDDMSGIILGSYYRYLTGQDIKFDEQIKLYRDFWEKAKKEQLEREKKEFAAYHIADTVLFNYGNGFSSKAQENKYDDDLCIARGIITDINEEKLIIKVKLMDGCDRKGIIYYDNDGILLYNNTTGKMEKPRKRTKTYMKAGEENWFKYSEWETYH